LNHGWVWFLCCFEAGDALAIEKHLCRVCRYDLRLLPAGLCPECGAHFDPAVTGTFLAVYKRPPRWVHGVYLLCALHPVMVLAMFYGLMGMARIELGRWPVAYQDDPAFYGLDWLLDVMAMSCMVFPVAIGLGLGLGVFLLARDSQKGRYVGVWRLVLVVAGWPLFFLMVYLDPGGCWNWFLD